MKLKALLTDTVSLIFCSGKWIQCSSLRLSVSGSCFSMLLFSVFRHEWKLNIAFLIWEYSYCRITGIWVTAQWSQFDFSFKLSYTISLPLFANPHHGSFHAAWPSRWVYWTMPFTAVTYKTWTFLHQSAQSGTKVQKERCAFLEWSNHKIEILSGKFLLFSVKSEKSSCACNHFC